MPKFLDLIQYADKNDDIKTIDLSVNSIKGTTPIRDELGLFKVGNESTSPQNPLDAVNKKYVDEKIASSVASGETDFNLKNSGGQGSLIQTHVISSSGTPYNNIASGPASIALGKNTQALGNTDFVIGQNNEDNSSGSFVGGSNCWNTGNYAFVFGRYLKNTQIGAVRLGSYNKENDYTAFSIGIGDVDHRENGLEYDAYTNTLSVPKGNILYGTNLQGNNAKFSGEVKIGKEFIGALGGPFVFRVGSYNKTSNVSGFEVDRNGDTTFFGKLKSTRTPVESDDVTNKGYVDGTIDALTGSGVQGTGNPPLQGYNKNKGTIESRLQSAERTTSRLNSCYKSGFSPDNPMYNRIKIPIGSTDISTRFFVMIAIFDRSNNKWVNCCMTIGEGKPAAGYFVKNGPYSTDLETVSCTYSNYEYTLTGPSDKVSSSFKYDLIRAAVLRID